MSCIGCEKYCKRRTAELPDRHKVLCATRADYAKLWDDRYGVTDESVIPDSLKNLPAKPTPKHVPKKKQGRRKPRGLGDITKSALEKVGVTEERVTDWLGRPCGCPERRRKLNRLSAWARRVLGAEEQADEDYIDELNGIVGLLEGAGECSK